MIAPPTFGKCQPNGRSIALAATAITILTLAFLAIGPACAKSTKSVEPGHHAKGIHGASVGHEKKRQAAPAANKPGEC
jgi:hypothetical protein